MVYVALLRGINVGGKAMLKMSQLKQSFERLQLEAVQTYINSGNVIFKTSEPRRRLPAKLEQQISDDFGLEVKVLLRSLPEIEALTANIPDDWVNDATHKSDVILLWPEVDVSTVIDELSWDTAHEALRYLPGALVWHTTKTYASKSKVAKLNQLPLYKQVTVRNPNTVRKLLALMQAI